MMMGTGVLAVSYFSFTCEILFHSADVNYYNLGVNYYNYHFQAYMQEMYMDIVHRRNGLLQKGKEGSLSLMKSIKSLSL